MSCPPPKDNPNPSLPGGAARGREHQQRRKNRWGSRPVECDSTPSSSAVNESGTSMTAVSEEEALAALVSSAEKAQEAKKPLQHKRANDGREGTEGVGEGGGRKRPRAGRWGSWGRQHGDGNRQHRIEDDGGSGSAREQRWGQADPGSSSKPEPTPKEKQKADFALSGSLASDAQHGNVYNGVLLKFTEPPEARAPNTRWRLYVFRRRSGDAKSSEAGSGDGDLLEVLHISRQSAYLFGRERKVADVPVDHPSLSKQHCVLQYRALPDVETGNLRCKPYIMDLGSTNGTFLNGVRIEEARYYELRKGDVLTLGMSSREYVLLTEHSTSA